MEPQRRSINSARIITFIFLGVFIASLLGNVYLWRQVSKLNQNPAEVSRQELQDIIAKVGKLMVLPSDETPTLATVNDPAKLKGQAFFANAKVGDKVLVYSKAGKVILYNPSEDRIVEVAPINSNTTGPTTQIPVKVITPTSTTTKTTSTKK